MSGISHKNPETLACVQMFMHNFYHFVWSYLLPVNSLIPFGMIFIQSQCHELVKSLAMVL